jgi:hypothetical protein
MPLTPASTRRSARVWTPFPNSEDGELDSHPAMRFSNLSSGSTVSLPALVPTNSGRNRHRSDLEAVGGDPLVLEQGEAARTGSTRKMSE